MTEVSMGRAMDEDAIHVAMVKKMAEVRIAGYISRVIIAE